MNVPKWIVVKKHNRRTDKGLFLWWWLVSMTQELASLSDVPVEPKYSWLAFLFNVQKFGICIEHVTSWTPPRITTAVKNRFQVFLHHNPLPTSFYSTSQGHSDEWKCYLFHRWAIFPDSWRVNFLWYAHTNLVAHNIIIILGNVFASWIFFH